MEDPNIVHSTPCEWVSVMRCFVCVKILEALVERQSGTGATSFLIAESLLELLLCQEELAMLSSFVESCCVECTR